MEAPGPDPAPVVAVVEVAGRGLHFSADAGGGHREVDLRRPGRRDARYPPDAQESRWRVPSGSPLGERQGHPSGWADALARGTARRGAGPSVVAAIRKGSPDQAVRKLVPVP